MTAAYQVIYNYALQLTGSKAQSKKIVDYTILEGARILAQTGDADKAQAFMVTKVRTLSYEYAGRRDKRWYSRVWERMKNLVR